MQNPKELIAEKLKWYLGEMGVSDVEPEVSLVADAKFGDFTTNVAMVCAKSIQANPRELSEKLVLEILENDDARDIFEKIEVAGPGFINFFLSPNYLSKTLQNIVQSSGMQSSLDKNNPQKVIVEFGDPNPFKEIHIGHLRNFCIGESFSRLLESQSNQVVRANYQGDVGLHVAKAIWGLLKHEEEFLDSSKSEDEKVKILAESYVEGATEFESNETAKQEIIEINKKIYGEDESLRQLWEEGRKVSLEHFEELYSRIGVRYDKYYFESATAKKGKEVVLSHLDDGIFERHDGAVIYRGEQNGLHTRVFLTSADYATYEGKDLALAILKNEDESYDESVILTGNEQLEYFQVMLAALKKIKPELAEKTKHLTFGHVRLKEGKMSSRTGDVITASWLLDEAVSRVKKAFPEMDSVTAEKVGIGAVKYSMLKFSIPSDIHFSFEESISLEGNSGPYLQYTYVRTLSVLNKFETLNSKFETNPNIQFQNLEKVAGPVVAPPPSDNPQSQELPAGARWGAPSASHPLEIEEQQLLRFLAQFPYHIEQAAADFAPNLVCNYLFELAQKFNLFYQKHKIIGSEKEQYRLQLTLAVGQVLQNGLKILGIETVERM